MDTVNTDEPSGEIASATFEESLRISNQIWPDISVNPGKYRLLTGDRPTGSLHIGHLFGSLQNRVKIQNFGVTTFIVIADYQVLTDRDTAGAVSGNVREIVLDYLAAGLDPFAGNTFIFPHSHVPALNQLLLPFLALVTMPELDRNPTVKEEIRAAGLRTVNASMFTYPVHQAADILFCRANIVPVGKDQLPHLELTRKVARRFNERFSPEKPLFPVPHGLLSDSPTILGLDGGQKMSKSRNNAILLKASPEETAKLIKGAKTDSDRRITYDPANRPEVANLLKVAALASGRPAEEIAAEIGDGGGGKLKGYLTEVLNAYLEPLRSKRREFAKDPGCVPNALKRGIDRANEEAEKTLEAVRKAMGMRYL